MKKQKTHPEWVLSHKRHGTELRLLNGKYYLYEVTSKWNPQKKRSQKITGKLLGRITPEGFIASEKHRLRELSSHVLIHAPVIKEYGASHLIRNLFEDHLVMLQNSFPELWQEIISLAFIRLMYQAPIKNVGYLFEKSFLSEIYQGTTLGEKRTSALYRRLGTMREQITTYMHNFISADDHVLIDATNIISYSERLGISKPGYNSKREFDPQVNLMLIFSTRLQLPVYYRVIPGNIKEVSAFKLTLDECGVSNVTIIADKGFYSDDNIATLEQFKAQYIIPLRRNCDLIDYSGLNEKDTNDFFKYQGRFIWYAKPDLRNNRTIYLFFDAELRAKEENDYLSRIETHPENYSIKEFHQKRVTFGTIAFIANLKNRKPQEIYEGYKLRNQVEMMIDSLKNTLQADTAYMQNEEAFNGWMFINFIALQWYYKITVLLKQNNLLANYSPKDLLMLFREIRTAKIADTWRVEEIPKKILRLIDKLQIKPIT
jgi:transposase